MGKRDNSLENRCIVADVLKHYEPGRWVAVEKLHEIINEFYTDMSIEDLRKALIYFDRIGAIEKVKIRGAKNKFYRIKDVEKIKEFIYEKCGVPLADPKLVGPLLETLRALFGIHEDLAPETRERLVLAAAPYVLMLLDDIRCHVMSALRDGNEPKDAVAFVFHNRYGFFVGDHDSGWVDEYVEYVEKALEKMKSQKR